MSIWWNRLRQLKTWTFIKLCCSCSFTKSCPTLCNPMDYSMPGSPVLHYFPAFIRFMSTDGGAIQPSHPLSPPSPAFNLSQHQGFSSESALCIKWPKYWSFGFSISSSNEYSRLISFRINWFDLLAVQRTLRSLLYQHNLKASILWHSAFSMVQLSHPYMITGKTIALTIQTFVSKVMSLLFNGLSRFVIAFLPRSKHLWIAWL